MFLRNIAVFLIMFFAFNAHAEVIDISAIINSSQESPAPTGVAASAGGFASLQFDDVSKELSWNIAWQDLTGPPTGMHFHGPAGVGQTAGVQVNIGAISGLVSPSIGSTVISDELESQLLSGQLYINIHTATNGSGEIRGQVVPEPSSVLLGLIGMLSLLSAKRRLGR